MVTYAQQTDPEKAKISSIDTTKTIGTTTETVKKVTPNTGNNTSEEQAMFGSGLPTPTVPTVEPVETKPQEKQAITDTKKTGSYYKDVYLPTVYAEREKRANTLAKEQAVETSKRLATTQSSVIATDYKNGGVSAMELQALKETDPLKFQEVSLALEKQNTLDAINQNQEQFMTNYKSLTDKYMQAWDATLTDTTGQELRQKVFEQYGLNKSNDMIKNYTTQIDNIDDELRNLEDWTGTGDAMLDRGEIVRRGRDLSRQRMDTVRARQAEVDYYRLGLEQADAVVSDYKQEQGQRLEMMGKQFEVATGMTQMEFEMKDKQNRDYLTSIDEGIAKIEAEIVSRQKTESDRFYSGSLLSLYDEFSPESKAALANLPPEQLESVLKNYGDRVKLADEKYYKEMDYKYKDREFDLKAKEFNLKSNESAMKNVEVVKLDDGSIILVNKATGSTNTAYQTPSSSPIRFNESEINSIIDFCITNRGGRTNIQCGELVNDYWTKQMGYKIGMKDTYESKVKAIQGAGQSQTPIAGGVFAFPGGNYGHTGIVTKVLDDGSIEVLEANRSGGNGSYPEINTYSSGKVKSMVFSMPPATGEEYSVDFNAIELPKDAKESQIKALTFANRMRDSHEKLITLGLEDVFVGRSGLGQVWQNNTFQVFKATTQKDMDALKQSFISGVLRSESGAAITDTEFDRYEKMYFPLPGDTSDTLKKKQAMREESIKGMYIQAGSDKGKTRIADYYDPSMFRSRIDNLNTPKVQYQDEVDNELAQYGMGNGILSTVPDFN